MAVFSNLTLADLRAKTAAQIAAVLKTKIDTLTKRQLINLVLAIRDYDTDRDAQQADAAVVTYRLDGQIKAQVQAVRDVLGAKVGSKRVDWSYYPGGEVRDIVIRELDGSDNEISKRTIRHYTDGRQPEVD